MSAGKATRSRDGQYRLDLRVPVRVDLRAAAVAIALGSNADADEIAEAGAARALRWARDGIGTYGLDHVHMGDTDGIEAEIEAAERRLVDLGIFPPAG